MLRADRNMTMQTPPTGATTAFEKASHALACACLVAFPALLLLLPTVANASFGLLVALSVVAVAVSLRAGRDAWRPLIRNWPLMTAMASLPLALLWHQLAARPGLPHIPYTYWRFALFVPLAGGLVWMGRAVRLIEWGFVVGAIGSACLIHQTVGLVRPMHVGVFNLIPFSNLCLLMGMLALISIGWGQRHWLEIALKVLAGIAGLYGSYLSGTRGNWIAIPVLLLVVIMSAPYIRARLRWPLLIALVAAMGAVGYASEGVTDRWRAAAHGLSDFAHGQDVNTPEGFRLQLWRGSLRLLARQPWVGTGPENWKASIAQLSRDGELTPAATNFDHSHNDILYAAATLGVPGLLAVLALYFVPAIFFLRNIRHADETARIAAASGLAVVAGFFLYGLTETMFYGSLANAFYSLTLATCFALIAGSKEPAEAVAR